MRILFSNAPWHKQIGDNKEGWYGVKAGSRWPHTYPWHGGPINQGYVPFPFFLATAGALAKKEGINAIIRDSVALGESYEEFYGFVQEYKPRIVLLETTTPSLSNDLAVARNIKKILGQVYIIFTGMHAGLEKTDFLLKNQEIDLVVYSEYEYASIEVIKAIIHGKGFKDINNIIYREHNCIQKNEFKGLISLNQLPWPERESLPSERYFDSVGGLQRPQLQIQTTRGCPFGCIFCVWPQVMYRGGVYRKRDPIDVVNEIEFHLNKYPYNSIYIDDDTFNVDAKHVLEIAKLMKERGLNRIPWSFMGRADLMSEEILIALKEAGLFSVKYGVESASQEVLNDINKKLDLDRVKKMIIFTHKLGIKVHLTFTFGLPSDTLETIEQTIELACSLPGEFAQFSIATPFPGTKMYELYERNGWLTTTNWDCYNGSTTSVSRTERFTGAQLEDFVRRAYVRFSDSRKADYTRFKEMFCNTIIEYSGKGDKLLILQSANYLWTQEIIRICVTMSREIHLLLHRRFVDKFEYLLPTENLHIYDEPQHFKFDKMQLTITQLTSIGFAGAIVPYSNSDGEGYEEVEKVAEAAGGRIIAGVTINRRVIKPEGVRRN